MPIYEYKCADCSHEFEELMSSSDAKIACPKCKSEKTQKQFSVVAAPVVGGSSAGPNCGQASCPSRFT